MFSQHLFTKRAVCLAALVSAGGAWAQDTNGADNAQQREPAFKLTPSYYRSSDGNDASDLNLRASIGDHTVWIGAYRDRAGFSQARAGYEFHQDSEALRVIWSAQLASRGFIGGSVTAEVGGANYAIVGWGRTNLHDYYNLNFDPNDAITVGLGSRAIPDTEVSLFRISDDRLGTHQHVTHCVLRYKSSNVARWTLDASHKSGLTGDDLFIHGNAVSLTYDYKSLFLRLAEDQFANFTRNRATRISLGARF